VEALGSLGDTGAVASITELLNDKHESIRKSAQEALDKLNAKSPAL
jgi:HEAT repeat protein